MSLIPWFFDFWNSFIGQVIEYLCSGKLLDWLLAIAGFGAAVASLVGSAVTAVVAWLGFKTSRQTHDLQKQVELQRIAHTAEMMRQQAEYAEQERLRVEAGEREMFKLVAESESRREAMSQSHAWFKLTPIDRLGQRWRLTNVGARSAEAVSVEDHSIGVHGGWADEMPEVSSLERGGHLTVALSPFGNAPRFQLLKVSWSEWDYNYDSVDEEGEESSDDEQMEASRSSFSDGAIVEDADDDAIISTDDDTFEQFILIDIKTATSY